MIFDGSIVFPTPFLSRKAEPDGTASQNGRGTVGYNCLNKRSCSSLEVDSLWNSHGFESSDGIRKGGLLEQYTSSSSLRIRLSKMGVFLFAEN